jgi:uncharacterized iron-regulated membrane protein
MQDSILSTSRKWHRRLASLFFAFFFIIAGTGLILGWKFLFTKTIYESAATGRTADFHQWLPLDSLEKKAALSLNSYLSKQVQHSDRVDVRLTKGTISFYFPGNYNVQLDGASGKIIRIEQKNGGWIQDLHDGAIIGSWIGIKSGAAKTIYSSVLGLSLLFLTVSGFYLWYKPKQIKRKRNIARSEKAFT